MVRPPIQRVDAATVRELFNRLYLADAPPGCLQETVEKSRAVSERSHEPPGTLSQTVRYANDRGAIAVVHRYLRPDGTLGASQMPDPKSVRDERGTWHALIPRAPTK